MAFLGCISHVVEIDGVDGVRNTDRRDGVFCCAITGVVDDDRLDLLRFCCCISDNDDGDDTIFPTVIVEVTDVVFVCVGVE